MQPRVQDIIGTLKVCYLRCRKRGPLTKREVAGTLRALGCPPQTPLLRTIVLYGAREYMEGARSHATDLVAYLEGPCLCIENMQNI